ncbi:hypothetical protein ACTXT7_009851 [Hymenolepis weldensis]
MPDPTLQEQPKISLKKMAGKSCITHHILPISSTNRTSTSFYELAESFGGTKAHFKRRGRNEAIALMKILENIDKQFVLASFAITQIRLMKKNLCSSNEESEEEVEGDDLLNTDQPLPSSSEYESEEDQEEERESSDEDDDDSGDSDSEVASTGQEMVDEEEQQQQQQNSTSAEEKSKSSNTFASNISFGFST